jgi:predicted RNase H-like HicB family nuclease
MAASAVKERTMQHYYAVAEPDGIGGFWISFPGRDGITSAATSAAEIVAQARDALESVLMYPPGDILPPSIEDGAKPPSEAELAEFEAPLVVVIPFEPATAAKAA